MGVGRQAPAALGGPDQFPAEVDELALVEAAFDKRPGVDPGSSVALEEDLVAHACAGLAPEEVVEADFVQRGRGGEGGQVAADAFGDVVINFSICGSPGNHGSRLAGMLLTYGLEMVAGNPTWVSCARSRSFINKKLARSLPCTSSTSSKDPTHSSVSVGSMSGS
jgi:hypothetical protein